MVKIAMQYGTCGASALAYGSFGNLLGPIFHRYVDGHRFAKLACDLVEKHKFIAYQAKMYHLMGNVSLWTQPIASAIDFMQTTFRTAVETGDLAFACYGMSQPIAGFLLRNDPLDAVWRRVGSRAGLRYGRQSTATLRTSSRASNASSRPCRDGPGTFPLSTTRQFDEARL